MTWVEEARGRASRPSPIGLVGNAAEVLPELLARGVVPDVVTDQTSAHDPLYGYIPAGMTLEEAAALRPAIPDEYLRRSMDSMTRTCRPCSTGRPRARSSSTTATTCASGPSTTALKEAFDYPGFVPAYIRPLFCEGKGPFRWVALSGDPEDIYATDEAILELFPEDEHLARWISLAQQQIEFQGLPARICWLGYGERARAGLRFNELVASGRGQGAHRHRPRPSGQRLGGQPQPRDRRRCATAPTPSPTGRSSTR